MIKILIVDDIDTNRLLLKKTLITLGYADIVEATNGSEAIDKYKSEKPDLIIMDIMMPGIDGHMATTAIKNIVGDEYIPIIFLTALNSPAALSEALSSGGDDFISKPFSVDILKSKILAHLRIRSLNKELNLKNKLLVTHNYRLEYEQELIEHFFNKATENSFLDEKIIKFHMSSLSTFNGDLLLTERAPDGGLYLVMGDFTGHGLTAAMGTLPVAMIFFKMVSKGCSVRNIAREINLQLYNLMPTGVFFTATIVYLNSQSDSIDVWSGGAPTCYWLSKDGISKGYINSHHMPLGILSDTEFESSIQTFQVEIGDKLYLYSDGVIEAKNPNGELFGNERLKDILVNEKNNRYEKVLEELEKFTDVSSQTDDITFVELNCQIIPAKKKSGVVEEYSLPWNISLSLSKEEICSENPIANISMILCNIPVLIGHKAELHTILSEMFSNSLEHSILNLQSKAKHDGASFVDYYEERDKALVRLKSPVINYTFNFFIKDKEAFLEIETWDNGFGFKHKAVLINDDKLFGRGLMIISGLSETMTFSEDGKKLNVLYKL